MEEKKLTAVNLGLTEYKEALDLQMKIQKLVMLEKLGHVLLILEHLPVITLGVGAKQENVLAAPELLRAKGVELFQSSRGGDVTYHGPGQIVGYPILNLNHIEKDVKVYVRKLEEVTIRMLKAEYGIDAERSPGFPGVWVGNDKITAIGCSVKHWVTMHGFALNVNTDLDGFGLIHPCGIRDRGVTSLKKITGTEQNLQRNMELVEKYFCEVFGMVSESADPQVFRNEIEDLSYQCVQAGLA